MANQFRLPIPLKTTLKSIRFPNEVLDQIETAIQGTGVSFSAFVIEATRVALNHLQCDADVPHPSGDGQNMP